MGRLIISVVPPVAGRGRFASIETNAPFVLEGTYFGRHRFEGVEERNGLRMHFAGWSQPLEAYATALEERDSRSRLCANRFPTSITDETTWRAVPAFRCFSG